MVFIPLLEDNERSRIVVDPRLALDIIIIMVFKYGYSIHADVKVNGNEDEDKDKEIKKVIQLTIKKKDKRTIHISKRAKMLIESYLH